MLCLCRVMPTALSEHSLSLHMDVDWPGTWTLDCLPTNLHHDHLPGLKSDPRADIAVSFPTGKKYMCKELIIALVSIV